MGVIGGTGSVGAGVRGADPGELRGETERDAGDETGG